MRSGGNRIALAGVVAAAALALPASAGAATIAVGTTADEVSGLNGCSLREAISAARDNDTGPGHDCTAGDTLGTDTIVLGAGTYGIAIPNAGAGEDANATGDLDIDSPAYSSVHIVGAGASDTRIDGDGHDRVFDVLGSSVVVFEGVEITGGAAPDGADGGVGPDHGADTGMASTGGDGTDGESGGGIRNAGDTTLTDARVDGNGAGAGGDGGDGGNAGSGAAGNPGAASTGGTGGNGGNGGGVMNDGGATLHVNDSALTDNFSGQGGSGGAGGNGGQGGSGAPAGATGGASIGGDGGFAGGGGAIYSDGSVSIARSFVESNSAGDGGSGGDGGHAGAGGDGTVGGGAGGASAGGQGVYGGFGGGIDQEDGTVSIVDSSVSSNDAGFGGAGGFGGHGGDGGSGGSSPGAGGNAAGGRARSGGAGGAWSASGTNISATGSTFANNRSGAGGAGGGGGFGGDGTNGGSTSGGFGGDSGAGAGIAFLGGSAAPNVVNATIASNDATSGGDGGDGGAPGSGGTATATGGDGGSGANGGAAIVDTAHTVTFTHATIAGNARGLGGNGGDSSGTPGTSGDDGTTGGVQSVSGTATYQDSVIAANVGDQCGGVGTFSGPGHNLSFPDDGTCDADLHGDPKLGALKPNGGLADTMLPLAGSAAIDAAGTGFPCQPTDERGVTRPKGAACDLGAVEKSLPAAVTGDPGAVTANGAQLTGTVNPGQTPASYHFEFGKTTGYGSTTNETDAGSGGSPVAVSATIGGLTPSTLYHYRLVATSPDGVALGADRTFTTPAGPPPDFTGVSFLTATARATRKGRIGLTLSCPTVASVRCTGTLKLTARIRGRKKRGHKAKKKRVTLGTAAFTIASGKTGKVTVKLSRAGRKALGKAKAMTATQSASTTDGLGRRKDTHSGVTVRAPKKKRHKKKK